jgi:signal peptidase II
LHGLQTERRTTLTFAIRRRLAFALFSVFLLDYFSKYLAIKYLGTSPKKIIGSFLKLNLTVNNGAAFSFGTGSGKYFAIFAICFIAVVLYIGRRIDSKVWATTLGTLAGGVSGNLSDRLFRAPGGLNGGVIDWIQLPHWPVFNLADVSIDSAVIAIIYLLMKKVPLNSQRIKNG